MNPDVYIDLEILAKTDNGYLVQVSKNALNDLVTFNDSLTVRHWDGEKPVVLEPYGDDAVRTQEDASEANNLDKLPQVSFSGLLDYLNIVS